MSPTPPTGVVDADASSRERGESLVVERGGAGPSVPAHGPARTHRWRHRGPRSAAFAAALGAVMVLAGCQVENTPTGYSSSGSIVEANFVAACTGNIPSDAGTTTSLGTPSKCGCMYSVFVGSVPFNDNERPKFPGYPTEAPTFEATENELRTDTNALTKLPEPVQTALKNCINQASVG